MKKLGDRLSLNQYISETRFPEKISSVFLSKFDHKILIFVISSAYDSARKASEHAADLNNELRSCNYSIVDEEYKNQIPIEFIYKDLYRTEGVHMNLSFLVNVEDLKK